MEGVCPRRKGYRVAIKMLENVRLSVKEHWKTLNIANQISIEIKCQEQW